MPPREVRFKLTSGTKAAEVYMRIRNRSDHLLCLSEYQAVAQTRPKATLSGMLARPRYSGRKCSGGSVTEPTSALCGRKCCCKTGAPQAATRNEVDLTELEEVVIASEDDKGDLHACDTTRRLLDQDNKDGKDARTLATRSQQSPTASIRKSYSGQKRSQTARWYGWPYSSLVLNLKRRVEALLK
eukprot:2256891-Amphidinium_carterae.1